MRPLNPKSFPFEVGLALAALLGTAIAIAWLSVAPAGAQEATPAKSTVPRVENNREAPKNTEAAVQTQYVRVAAQTGDNGSTSVSADTNNTSQETEQPETRATPEPGEDEAQDEVPQQGTQRAAPTAARATDPLADETAQIMESNGDAIVDRIVIPVANCDVGANAIVTVQDRDGTQLELNDEDNVDITATQDRLVIVGMGESNNLQGVNLNGDNFEPGKGTVVSSAGITCGGDDGGDTSDTGNGDSTDNEDDSGGGTSSGNEQDNTCQNPRSLTTFGPETESQLTPEFRVTGNTFRLSYQTTIVEQNGFGGSLDIKVLDEQGQPIGQGPLIFDQTRGDENIVAGPGVFGLDIRADNVEYTVTVEDCTGDAPNNDVMSDTVPNKPLPDTGGPPLLSLATLGLASAAVGVSVLRAGLRREG